MISMFATFFRTVTKFLRAAEHIADWTEESAAAFAEKAKAERKEALEAAKAKAA